jgi:hypothetical protein
MTKSRIFTSLLLVVATSMSLRAQWTSNGNVISTSQNVGIGITNPSTPIHVSKLNTSLGQTVDVASFSFQGSNHFEQANTFTEGKLVLGSQAYTNGLLRRAEIGFSTSGSSAAGGALKFYTSRDNLTWTPTLQMVIDHRGWVGIGTPSPTQKLEVLEWGNDASISTLLKLSQANAGNAQTGTGTAIEFATGDNYNAPQTLGKITVENTYFDQRSRMIFSTKASSEAGVVKQMVLTENGQVGIGTMLTLNPNNYTLAVKGKIGAQEVQVENTSSTWADYVFENDYKLRSLNEVETYIKENKHLPEIPSKEEVAENGHKLGEMDVLLLKKIEELTLYVIALKKQLEEQQQQVEILKKR